MAMDWNTALKRDYPGTISPHTPVSPEWDVLVKKEYPRAREGYDVTLSNLQTLEKDLGISRDKVLLATCLCSDDINTASTGFSHCFFGPFTIGGLGGLPFGGITAVMAYGHHIPEHGAAFIFYGPHIGMTKEGELGRMLRPGQAHYSNSCGALMLALSRLTTKQGLNREATSTFDDDHEQRVIEQSLLPFSEQIVTSANPRKEVTEMTYAIIHHQLRDLVMAAREEIHARYIVMLGGVTINTDPDVPDYVDVRHHEVIENH